jgi:uncharacterized protein with HEPN domain
MSGGSPRLREYLAHISRAIERIRRYNEDMDGAAFAADELIQDAVIRNLEIIGEACRNIDRGDPGFAAAHPRNPASRSPTKCATRSHTAISRSI